MRRAAKTVHRAKTPPLLLDVREKEELESSRNDEIITVCRSGARAHTAAQILKKAGFEKAHVLAGGMLVWNASKSPAGE
jgi:rhodanese-related sulfurtransferase